MGQAFQFRFCSLQHKQTNKTKQTKQAKHTNKQTNKNKAPTNFFPAKRISCLFFHFPPFFVVSVFLLKSKDAVPTLFIRKMLVVAPLLLLLQRFRARRQQEDAHFVVRDGQQRLRKIQLRSLQIAVEVRVQPLWQRV